MATGSVADGQETQPSGTAADTGLTRTEQGTATQAAHSVQRSFAASAWSDRHELSGSKRERGTMKLPEKVEGSAHPKSLALPGTRRLKSRSVWIFVASARPPVEHERVRLGCAPPRLAVALTRQRRASACRLV